MSEDPVFLNIGTQKFDNNLLSNPQSQNSYSYALNNPILKRDPDGRCVEDLCVGEVTLLSVLAMTYGPQLFNTLQQLTTPVGQWLINSNIDDAKTLANPNSSFREKTFAGIGIGITVAPEADEMLKSGLTSFEDVASHIAKNGKLPDNFITKAEAEKLGWIPGKDLSEFASGKSIGGDIFENRANKVTGQKLLPDREGRIWHEADIGYKSGVRGSERIIYSNDGAIYKTPDHYGTVTKIK